MVLERGVNAVNFNQCSSSPCLLLHAFCAWTCMSHRGCRLNKLAMVMAQPVHDLLHGGKAACSGNLASRAMPMTMVYDVGRPGEEQGGAFGDDFGLQLTYAQQQALFSLKNNLNQMGVPAPHRQSPKGLALDEDLLRFLKARSFDVSKARAMYVAMLDWRRQVGADTIVEWFSFPERKAVKELYPHFHHKTDKYGRPIYIEQYGQLRLEDLLNVTSLDRLLLYHIKEWEIQINWKFPACSRATGRPITQSLTILDLKGLTMKHLNKQVRQFLEKVIHIDQDYYPEFLGHMVIINVPATFKAMWQLVKPWLDKSTQQKIEVHGSNFTGKLLELVDRENLPECFGGTCQCTGGCEWSDAGPWNQFPYQPWPEDTYKHLSYLS